MSNILTYLSSAEHWLVALIAGIVGWIVSKLHSSATNAPKAA